MKKNIAIGAIVVVLVSAGFFYFKSNEKIGYMSTSDQTSIQQAVSGKKTEEVFCSATVPSHCYLYRCNTGYLYTISVPAPGSNPLRCTDNSEIENVKEVSNVK